METIPSTVIMFINQLIYFYREKLPQYDIDLSFMFHITQNTCDNLMESASDDPLAYIVNGRKNADKMFKVLLQKS